MFLSCLVMKLGWYHKFTHDHELCKFGLLLCFVWVKRRDFVDTAASPFLARPCRAGGWLDMPMEQSNQTSDAALSR